MFCAVKIVGFVMVVMGLGIIAGLLLPCPWLFALILIAVGVAIILK